MVFFWADFDEIFIFDILRALSLGKKDACTQL